MPKTKAFSSTVEAERVVFDRLDSEGDVTHEALFLQTKRSLPTEVLMLQQTAFCIFAEKYRLFFSRMINRGVQFLAESAVFWFSSRHC
jgi:hypothetical protein